MNQQNKQPKILFVGEGHGAHAAYLSLAKVFENVYAVKDIDSALDQLVPQDKRYHELAAADFDLIVTAGYRHRYPADLIEKIKIVNVHYALLPRFRGLHSLVWAMLNKEPRLGLTMHLVNEDFDAGPVLHQFSVEHKKQTSWELMHQFDQYVQDHLGSVVKDYWDGKIEPVPQNHSEALWCCRRNSEDCRIDFNASHEDIEVFFRALVKPYPIPFIKIKDVNYGVVEHQLVERKYNVPTGRVVNVDKDGAWIKTQDGFLVIKTLECPDGLIIDAATKLKLGMRL